MLHTKNTMRQISMNDKKRKPEKKLHEKPLKADMPFNELLARIVRVPPPQKRKGDEK